MLKEILMRLGILGGASSNVLFEEHFDNPESINAWQVKGGGAIYDPELKALKFTSVKPCKISKPGLRVLFAESDCVVNKQIIPSSALGGNGMWSNSLNDSFGELRAYHRGKGVPSVFIDGDATFANASALKQRRIRACRDKDFLTVITW